MAARDYAVRHYVPIEELTTPRDGECRTNRYWVVHPEHGALFVARFQGDRMRVAQCNSDRRLPERLLENHPGHEIRFIEVAYLGQTHGGE